MKIQVECHSDRPGEETPFRFRLGSRSIEVTTILDRWMGEDHEYFKILAEGDIYILRHDTINRSWKLTFFSES
jgi:hypothetical protein